MSCFWVQLDKSVFFSQKWRCRIGERMAGFACGCKGVRSLMDGEKDDG